MTSGLGAGGGKHKSNVGGGFGTPFAIGGLIRGPGGPRSDTIPILASAGEFIMNAGATALFGDLLPDINNGKIRTLAELRARLMENSPLFKLPGFAAGGPVSGAGPSLPAMPTAADMVADIRHLAQMPAPGRGGSGGGGGASVTNVYNITIDASGADPAVLRRMDASIQHLTQAVRNANKQTTNTVLDDLRRNGPISQTLRRR